MINRSLLFLLILSGLVRADAVIDGTSSPIVPGEGFPASRYQLLWTKSPFVVATTDSAPESPDYMMVGIAHFDGIDYVSLIEKKNQDHFLVSSDRSAYGLTLVSVERGRDPSDTTATFLKDGASITLKLEQLPSAGLAIQTQTPQITFPGAPPPLTPPVDPVMVMPKPYVYEPSHAARFFLPRQQPKTTQ